MELPHMGEHCEEPSCHKLDFLPFKCNLCRKQYCLEHHTYSAHSCPESHKLDVQVPICPLCDQPVANKPGQTPDLAVNDHLDNNCKTKTKKIYKNCSVTGCKKKEIVSVQCGYCSLNFCVGHRHPIDHKCKGEQAARREMRTSLFKKWFKGESDQSSSSNGEQYNIAPRLPPFRESAAAAVIQGNMSEEAALNQAIMVSTQGNTDSNSLTQVSSSSEDEDLARAIAASLEEQDGSSSSRRNKTSDCTIS